MESYRLPQFPAHLSCVHAALYTNVSDTGLLRKRLISASTAEGTEGEREREAINFAFIEARLITSVEHLKTAVYQAVLADAQGALLTKTVHSEIIYGLNPTHNISEAMRRYGVSDATTALLVVRVAGPEMEGEAVERAMDVVVHGTKTPLSELGGITDWAAVKKYHKLANERAVKDAQGDLDREHAVINEIVLSSAAMKSVAA